MWYDVLIVSVTGMIAVIAVSLFMYQCIKRISSIMEMQVQALEKLGRGKIAAELSVEAGAKVAGAHLQGMNNYEPLANPDMKKHNPHEIDLEVEKKINGMKKTQKRKGVQISRVSS